MKITQFLKKYSLIDNNFIKQCDNNINIVKKLINKLLQEGGNLFIYIFQFMIYK